MSGPVLRELHWLPLVHRINFRVVLLMMYMAHNRLCPVYFNESETTVSSSSHIVD